MEKLVKNLGSTKGKKMVNGLHKHFPCGRKQ